MIETTPAFVRSEKTPIPHNSWDRPPWNRWAFQHVRELLPTVEVWRGTGPVWHLPEATQDLGGLEFTTSNLAVLRIEDWLQQSFTDGFAVLSRGELIYERYFNGMTQRSPHLSQSVAKSITGTAAGVLVGQGLMNPNELLVNYIPELSHTAWHDALMRHSLDMVSGVRFDEAYESPDSDIALTDFASGWKQAGPGVVAPANVWDQILGLTEQHRHHGMMFEYRSIETDVIAHCMQRVTQIGLAELISRELWQPLGAEESAYFTVDSAGYPLADGGFNACLRDYARFGLMLANRGWANGRQIVPEPWIDDTFHCHPGLFGDPYTAILPHGAYRNQFWIRDARRRVMMARGVFGQLIYADLDRQLVVVILSSWPEFLSTPRRLDELAAIDAIDAHLG